MALSLLILPLGLSLVSEREKYNSPIGAPINYIFANVRMTNWPIGRQGAEELAIRVRSKKFEKTIGTTYLPIKNRDWPASAKVLALPPSPKVFEISVLRRKRIRDTPPAKVGHGNQMDR